VRGWEYVDGYRQLVEEVMAHLEPSVAEQIKRRPRYIETVGESNMVGHDFFKSYGVTFDFENMRIFLQ
jgi:hypothetical protein